MGRSSLPNYPGHWFNGFAWIHSRFRRFGLIYYFELIWYGASRLVFEELAYASALEARTVGVCHRLENVDPTRRTLLMRASLCFQILVTASPTFHKSDYIQLLSVWIHSSTIYTTLSITTTPLPSSTVPPAPSSYTVRIAYTVICGASLQIYLTHELAICSHIYCYSNKALTPLR